MTSSRDNHEWLSTTLSQILSSPHITMPKHTGNIRMGHGPVDVFSTRFINTFTEDVKATIAGQEMSRDELKASLLALQKHWNPNDLHFSPIESADNDLVSTSCTWSPKDSDVKNEIQASASIIVSGGRNRINNINLQGDASLFGR